MKLLKRPNILLIYTDQQRTDSLGCYGNPLAVTPNIDALAEDGVLMENFFVQAPVCMPSRINLLSGRYCSSTGVGANDVKIIPQDIQCLQHYLKPYGYHTCQIGKLHFQDHSRRDHKQPTDTFGFDHFVLSDEPGLYDDAYIAWVKAQAPYAVSDVRCGGGYDLKRLGMYLYNDKPREPHEPYLFEADESYSHSSFVASEMVNYIKSRDKNNPFFAIAGFYAPHAPINPPERFVRMFDPSQMPLPVKNEGEGYSYLQDLTDEDWQKIRAYYLALVSHMDNCTGQILGALKESGLEEDTIVIFTSDHGEYLGDHGRVHKQMPGHDCVTRVPAVFKWPGRWDGGKNIGAMVECVDVVPTLLEACAIQIPPRVQGKSMLNILDGKEKTGREDVLCEMFLQRTFHKAATIRTKRYKYHYSTFGDELLYDIEKDPHELTDLMKNEDYKDILSDMRRRLSHRLLMANDHSGVQPVDDWIAVEELFRKEKHQ